MGTAITRPADEPSRATFVTFTLIAAAVASLAAGVTAGAELEVWAMFAGFIAWFTRPTGTRSGVYAMACLWLGIALGALSGAATAVLAGWIGTFPVALAAVTFGLGVLIVGLRATQGVDNMLAWFLGLVTWFAADFQVRAGAFAALGSATAVGGLAGWACQALNRRLAEN